jgi:hypothetical protein
MVLVTDQQINMHPALKDKLDLMIHRMEKKGYDNFLLIDGKEGFGKTTLGSQICYYVSKETGRRFTHEDIYFRVKQLLEEMQKSRARIFLLDEAELDLLSEQRGKMQRYFMQMLMAARKKNHFIVAIIPTIKKLKSFVVERAIGFIRVYSPDNLSRGYYAYYKEESKNALYEKWQKSRKLEYKKYYTFNGRFSNKFKEFIDEEAYDKKKDEAIESIGKEEEKDSPTMRKLRKLQYFIWYATKNGIITKTAGEVAPMIDFTRQTISEWQHLPSQYPYLNDLPF